MPRASRDAPHYKIGIAAKIPKSYGSGPGPAGFA